MSLSCCHSLSSWGSVPGQGHKAALEWSQRLQGAAGGAGGRESGHARLEQSQALPHQHSPVQSAPQKMGLCKISLQQGCTSQGTSTAQYPPSLGKGHRQHTAVSQAATSSHVWGSVTNNLKAMDVEQVNLCLG